jgi:DNA-binding transcriptional ArsR family regulator
VAQHRTLPDLFEQLSQGVSILNLLDREELVFAPSFWGTPLIFLRDLDVQRTVLTFGVRPVHASLVPGEVVPDALLQALKAMADPTRLRILHYLTKEPVTPAELARRLRLRAPTVTHHLSALRLAGLVHITLEAGDERHYTARQEAIDGLQEQIKAFLVSEMDEAK